AFSQLRLGPLLVNPGTWIPACPAPVTSVLTRSRLTTLRALRPTCAPPVICTLLTRAVSTPCRSRFAAQLVLVPAATLPQTAGGSRVAAPLPTSFTFCKVRL